jgi:vitamin B12 transporter
MLGTVNLGYTPIAGTRLSLLLRARESTFGFNNLGSPTFDNANATGHVDSLLGRTGVTSQMFGGAFETGLFVGRLQEDRHYTEPLWPLDPNQFTQNSRYHAYRTDVQWNNTLHLNDFFKSSVLSATDLTFGYEYTGDAAKVRVQSVSAGFPFSQSANASMTTNAGYAGLQSTLWKRLTLTGQMRQDSVLNNAPFTWRLGGVLDAPEVLTHFKAAYGTAFRAPSLFDRFGVDSFGYVGNPNLKPERSQGWEIGFTTNISAAGLPNLLSFGATYFNTQIEDLIVAQFVPVNTAVNIGSAHIQGVESLVTLQPFAWLSADLAYTYTDARNADTSSQLLRRPFNSFAIDVKATPLPRLTIAPELLYTGPFRDFLVDNGGFPTADIVTSRQGLIFNLTVTYEITPQVAAFVSGRNLTNSQFEPVNGFRTPPTNVLAGVRVKL